jgi:hypothetical protein
MFKSSSTGRNAPEDPDQGGPSVSPLQPTGSNTRRMLKEVLLTDQQQAEHGCDEGEHSREHDRPADALTCPRQRQGQAVSGQTAGQRSDGEHCRADHEQQTTSEPVGQRARGEQQRREYQRVRIDDSLQLRQRSAECLLNLR